MKLSSVVTLLVYIIYASMTVLVYLAEMSIAITYGKCIQTTHICNKIVCLGFPALSRMFHSYGDLLRAANLDLILDTLRQWGFLRVGNPNVTLDVRLYGHLPRLVTLTLVAKCLPSKRSNCTTAPCSKCLAFGGTVICNQ